MERIVRLIAVWLLLFGQVAVNFSYADTPEVEEHIKTLEIGGPFNYRNLTIVPVYAKTVKDKTDYITLDEAVDKGYITVIEMDGGRVPQVKLTNNSSHYILLVAGEILSGCKQDRLVGRDALIGPKAKEVILPVYCSEQGRWTAKGSQFVSEANQAAPTLRKMVYAQESQSNIWEGIAKYSRKLAVESETQALQDVYRDEKVKGELKCYVDKLENIPRLEEDAIGVVVGLGEEIIAVDLFANPSLFAGLWPKLLKSYASLAISEQGQSGTLTQKQAKEVLSQAYRAKFSRQQGLDLGEELQADTDGIFCSGLAYHGALVHLAIFPSDGKTTLEHKGIRIPVIE